MDELWPIILTSLLSGLLGVVVTLGVQCYTAKRTEQMRLFRTLMELRSMGVSYEKTRALNLIDVVFYGVKTVIDAWRELYESYSPENKDQEKIKDNTIKLLEAMAEHLKYKNLNWEIIKKSYLPIAISDDMQGEAEFKKAQLALARILNSPEDLHHFMSQLNFQIGSNQQRSE